MPDYTVPALEKGLDVLELLATTATPIGQSAIAAQLGRSTGEIFRVLQTLEHRAYICRDADSGLYLLTTRLLELAGRQPALRGLILRAAGPMAELAGSTEQSCNLAVLDGAEVRVIAQQESPADFGFRVRVGAAFPLGSTATGAVLLAFCPADQRDALRAELAARGEGLRALDDRIERIRSRGSAREADARQAGILDLSYPVFGADGTALAALTVPYVATSYSAHDADAVAARIEAASVSISQPVAS
ncbi:MAG: IclR family transcriptional regulator [Microbacteriaceae bacterium]|nr:MAG: IclR family transcriptional regulator [Microbacteriaceae bacterium]